LAAPDIILDRPFVLIQESGSSLGITTDNNSSILFGGIVNIYETSDRYSIGDSVMFIRDGSTSILYDNSVYLLVREEFVFFKEVIPP